jgi:hypothetical protein
MNLEDVLTLAKDLLLDVGEVRPLLIVLGSKADTQIPLEQIPEDRAQKAKQLLGLGYAVGRDPKLGELRELFILFEGWMSTGSSPVPAIMPADDPNRQEVLVISHYQHRPVTTTIIAFRIRRTAEPDHLELERVEDLEGSAGQARSPLIEAFLYGYYGYKEGSRTAA